METLDVRGARMKHLHMQGVRFSRGNSKNIRHVANVANLHCDTGGPVITVLSSPEAEHKALARSKPLLRDYSLARAGIIWNFTGGGRQSLQSS